MQRTKEALIAQRQSKKDAVSGLETTRSFSFTQFPRSSQFQKSFLFLAIALALIAAPFLLPDVGKSFYTRRAVSSVSRFELNDAVHHGQFRRTPHVGDTRPNEGTPLHVGVSQIQIRSSTLFE